MSPRISPCPLPGELHQDTRLHRNLDRFLLPSLPPCCKGPGGERVETCFGLEFVDNGEIRALGGADREYVSEETRNMCVRRDVSMYLFIYLSINI